MRIINRQGRMVKYMTSVQERLKYSLPRGGVKIKRKLWEVCTSKEKSREEGTHIAAHIRM